MNSRLKQNYILLFLAITICINSCWGQTSTTTIKKGLTLGVEQDILPYVLGGFIATAWMGRDAFRYRFSYAQANNPKFFLAENIKSDQVQAFGMSFEYFFKEDFKGFWIGPGLGHWTNYVLTEQQQEIKNESFIFTLGGGYNYPLTNWLYVSPWVAMHLRTSGNDPISTGIALYQPTIFTPEIALKIGVKLGTKKNTQ